MRSEGERKELGGFLKACRARVDPATLGLPAGRRRTPGLKREEVALAIGVSVSCTPGLSRAAKCVPRRKCWSAWPRCCA